MGLLVNGKWHDEWDRETDQDGRLIDMDSQFRSWITVDGRVGPSGDGGFKAEPNRYHLYVAFACPWAHRALIMRKLKGLEGLISVSVVSPNRTEKGWTFEAGDGVDPDPVLGADYLYQVYAHAEPNYSGRVSVPVLYDLEQNKIVNNESAEIMRMFNTAFDSVGANENDYYPKELQPVIDQLNEEILADINMRVYQAAYSKDEAVAKEEIAKLYQALDRLDVRFKNDRYLLGDQLTEADWRLFVTLIRFDPVYHEHFPHEKKLVEYQHIDRYLKELYSYPGIDETVNFDHM